MPDKVLKIIISSFSYKQNKPLEDPVHGCGFVFDLRGIDNPGRLESFKKLTGQDKEVVAYLTTGTMMKEYLLHCISLIDITVNNYVERSFTLLHINFGCTGGQHRSVKFHSHTFKLVDLKNPLEYIFKLFYRIKRQ